MKKQKVELPNDGKFTSLDSFLKSDGNFGDGVMLKLPRLSAGHLLGFEIAQIQTLITWSQRQSIQHVIFTEDALSERKMTPLEICAVRLSKIITIEDEDVDVRSLIIKKVFKEIENNNNALESNIKMMDLWLFAFDGTAYSTPRALYTSEKKVKSMESFYYFISKYISLNSEIKSLSKFQRNEKSKRLLAAVVYELFKNTHDWARDSWDGALIKKSIRILHLKIIKRISIENGIDDNFFNYANDLKPIYEHFLEISIIDSGSGFAQRYGKKRVEEMVTMGEEYKFVRDCLDVHNSTSDNLMRGLGLFGVIKSLDFLNGFFSIRTGRLSLYRNLDVEPLIENTTNLIVSSSGKYNPWLNDANSHTISWTKMPFATGSLISIVVPLER